AIKGNAGRDDLEPVFADLLDHAREHVPPSPPRQLVGMLRRAPAQQRLVERGVVRRVRLGFGHAPRACRVWATTARSCRTKPRRVATAHRAGRFGRLSQAMREASLEIDL